MNQPGRGPPGRGAPGWGARNQPRTGTGRTGTERTNPGPERARTGTGDDEARPENDKDTRGLEQSYLARGQAQRVVELEAAVSEVGALALRAFGARDRVAVGALVTVEEEGREHRFFLAPHGGGTMLAGGAQVVTPVSPLGRALVGRRVDDEVEVRLPGRLRSFVIVALA